MNFAARVARSLTGTAHSTGRKGLVTCVITEKGKDFGVTKVFPKEVMDNCVVGNDLETLKQHPLIHKVESIMWVPPARLETMMNVFDEYKDQIKWVHCFWTGVDSMKEFTDSRLIDRPDIPLTNGKDAFSSSLAEYALLAALHFNKQVPRLQANRLGKIWERFPMSVLRGKVLGIIGFGDIAKATAKLAKAFGMNVLVLRRDPSQGGEGVVDDSSVFSFEGRFDLLQQSDFVVSVLPGTSSTKNFCGKEEFAAMNPSTVFISLGRGTTVDEDALYKALNTGRIQGAALDVFHIEPLPSTSPLWDLDNILISSHNADFTDDFYSLGYEVWQENCRWYIDGKPLLSLVDKELGY